MCLARVSRRWRRSSVDSLRGEGHGQGDHGRTRQRGCKELDIGVMRAHHEVVERVLRSVPVALGRGDVEAQHAVLQVARVGQRDASAFAQQIGDCLLYTSPSPRD